MNINLATSTSASFGTPEDVNELKRLCKIHLPWIDIDAYVEFVSYLLNPPYSHLADDFEKRIERLWQMAAKKDFSDFFADNRKKVANKDEFEVAYNRWHQNREVQELTQ